MNKCDFCPNSVLVNGKLVCPHNVCLLSSQDLKNMLEKLGVQSGKHK